MKQHKIFKTALLVFALLVLLAAGLVIGAYALVVNRVGAMSGFWGPILGSCLLSVGQVWPAVLGAFLIFGVVIGSIGTATSIRKYLEV